MQHKYPELERRKKQLKRYKVPKTKFDHFEDQMDPTDKYRTFHPIAGEYTFFSSAMEHSSG